MLEEYSLVDLEKMGLNPLISTTTSKIKAYFFLFVQSAIVMLSVYSLIFGAGEFYATADALVGTLSTLHTFAKQIYIFVQHKEFAKAINTTKEFWAKDQFGQEAAMKIDKILDVARKCVLFFKYSAIISIVSYIISPLASGERILPVFDSFFCNIEECFLCYVCFYALQVLFGVLCAWLVPAFDCMFLILISYGYCELEQVKLGFLNLELDSAAAAEEDLLKYVGVMVKQHNCALRSLEEVNALYSYILLLQFPLSVAFLCMTFFLITANSFPPTLLITLRILPFVLGAAVEIALYCAAGQLLIEQSESVADAVYSTKWWYRYQPRLRRAFCLIIQRSQRPVQITAGGVFGLHMETLVSILKGAGSALTLMQTFSGQK